MSYDTHPIYSGENIYDCPGYRLPTEAEWEYAYRAGTTTAFYNGPITNCDGSDAKANAIGWYDANSGATTHPVGQKQANDWGLYDMAGNVWEWCHDWWQTSLGSSAVTDPVGSGTDSRTARGGSCTFRAGALRAAERYFGFPPDFQFRTIGFRCARTLP